MEELGLWNYIHATSSGFIPIVAWESLHAYLTLIPALLLCVVVAGVMGHAVHKHRKYLQATDKTS